MAPETVDLVTRAFAFWIDGPRARFVEMLDPEVSWDLTPHPLPDFPDTGSGRDALLHHLRHYAEGWSDYSVELRETHDARDDVVCVLYERVSMGGSDAVLDRHLVLVWTVDGERLTRLRAFPTREAGLAALGVSPS
jgi:ketosteroid isomerase-like protein